MTRTPLMLALVAAAALAGCDNSDHTIVAGPGADEETNTAANANVTLPPAIMATKIYRCADNDVVYVDWLADNKSANIRTEPSGTPTQVTMTEPGKPMTAPGGYSLSGTPTAPTVKISVPGQSVETCKA